MRLKNKYILLKYEFIRALAQPSTAYQLAVRRMN